MKILDRITELLRDTQWHRLEEIKQEIPLPKAKLNELLIFLQEVEVIEKENGNLRITARGLRFLDLQS
jgi:DNA-binding IclR family transcriptional regulator